MTMTLKEFQVLSKRTAPFNAEPTNQQELYNIIGNYSMGMVGEYFEYQQALNAIGEVLSKKDIETVDAETGDVMHYAVNLLTVLGDELDESKLLEEVTHQDMDKALGDVLEIPKKYIFHGHELKKEEMIAAIYTVISKFKQAHPVGFRNILQKNIEKLKKRYPEKFTTRDSIKRVDVDPLANMYNRQK